MSGQVASHTRGFSDDQGAIVTPSGRFPSLRDRPVGSKRAGTWAEERALQTMSFKTVIMVCYGLTKNSDSYNHSLSKSALSTIKMTFKDKLLHDQ